MYYLTIFLCATNLLFLSWSFSLYSNYPWFWAGSILWRCLSGGTCSAAGAWKCSCITSRKPPSCPFWEVLGSGGAWSNWERLLAEAPHTRATEVAVQGEWKQPGFPSKNRRDYRDTGNNKWIKMVSECVKKVCEEKLESEKEEAASRETARVSVLWICRQWVTDLQDNSNITFHYCNYRGK